MIPKIYANENVAKNAFEKCKYTFAVLAPNTLLPIWILIYLMPVNSFLHQLDCFYLPTLCRPNKLKDARIYLIRCHKSDELTDQESNYLGNPNLNIKTKL